MEAFRFDTLTRSLSSRASRRVTLGGLGATVLVALGLNPEEDPALARKKGRGRGKRKKKQCPRKGDSPIDVDLCGQDCTNFLIDDGNCGGCAATGDPPGAACLPGRTTCIEGTCVEGDRPSSVCVEGTGNSACPPENVCCAEPIGQSDPQIYELHCRNLKQNTNHCGRCNNGCTEGKRPACCYGRCRDLHGDPLNCGACVQRCPKSKPICAAGQCHAKCPQGLQKCGKTCFAPRLEVCCNDSKVVSADDLQFDARNCGACGRDCGTYACCGGECCDYNAPACCSGQCTNVILNNKHCGECDNACKTNEFCRFGVCTCPLGMTCT